MTPYFETELGKLYCGDCLEILPGLDPVDLVLTDPPYIGLSGGLNVTLKLGVALRRNTQKTVGDPWNANLKWFGVVWEKTKLGAIVFCSFHSVGLLQNENAIALVSWYQRNAMPAMNNVPQYKTEFAWAYKKNPGLNWRKLLTFYDVPRLQSGCMAKERIVDESGRAIHPAQKPVRLLVDILAVGGKSVLDPFLGTGTTAVACERLGRQWIGIEISEHYCEIAARRIEREAQQGHLFPPPEQQPEQTSFLEG